jgi:hypothetical protein
MDPESSMARQAIAISVGVALLLRPNGCNFAPVSALAA